MNNWIQWEITDDAGDNPLGMPGEFEFDVEFDYDPGEPTQLGGFDDSGSEGCPPSTTITGASCRAFKLFDDNDTTRLPTKKENEAISAWFMSLLYDDPKLKRQIEACGLDQMYVEPYREDDWDD